MHGKVCMLINWSLDLLGPTWSARLYILIYYVFLFLNSFSGEVFTEGHISARHATPPTPRSHGAWRLSPAQNVPAQHTCKCRNLFKYILGHIKLCSCFSGPPAWA